jgi:hypothetical protein
MSWDSRDELAPFLRTEYVLHHDNTGSNIDGEESDSDYVSSNSLAFLCCITSELRGFLQTFCRFQS